MTLLTIEVLCVLLLATLIRSAFGLGEALVAVPLLSLRIPIQIAAPLAVLVSITIAGIVVVQDREKIYFRSVRWLVFSTIAGIPLGLVLLTAGHQKAIKAGLAILILVFSVYSLLGRTWMHLKADSRRWLFGCGFAAGILGGAYGMNGPPLVVYATVRGWSAQHFRATLQGYFLPAGIIGMAGYWLGGLWVPPVTRYYLLSLPVVLPATFLGGFLNKRMNGEYFLKYVYIGLTGVGGMLLLQTFR